MVKLPEKTQSTLHPVLINAASYTREEITQILKERSDRTFKPNTIPDKLLTVIAKTVSEHEDIRFGFRVLLTAGLLAERTKKQTVDAADIASAINQENSVPKLRELKALKDEFLRLKKKYERD